MRYMTFGKSSQFSLTETVASVTHIINPINSHNAMANLSQKRGGKGEREKYKKVLKFLSKVALPFIKTNCFDPWDGYQDLEFMDSNTDSTGSKWS